MGGAHVGLRKIDYDTIWKYFNELKITHYNGAPTVQTFLTNHHSAHRLNHTVKAMVAGSPPSPALIKRMMELNIEVIHVYGGLFVLWEDDRFRDRMLNRAPTNSQA